MEAKFKIGDVVIYKPFNKLLTIKNIYFKDFDGFSKSLGVEFIPTFMYDFQDTSLVSKESDLELDTEIKAKYFSSWSDEGILESNCNFNPNTKIVSNIFPQYEIGEDNDFLDEWLVLPNGEIITDFEIE